MKLLSSKEIAFIAIMAALGNVLSFLSIQLSSVLPPIQLGTVTISTAIDFSHLTTFITALFIGPIAGGLTGLLGGIVSAYIFGFSSGNYVTGFLLPVGKGVTGLMAGVLYKKIKTETSIPRNVIVAMLSYLPEGVIVALIFMVLMPAFMGLPMIITLPLTIQINIKALAEMVILGIIIAFLIKNTGFRSYINSIYDENL
jgi:hypothetical protein